jgi:proline iminopeptidase
MAFPAHTKTHEEEGVVQIRGHGLYFRAFGRPVRGTILGLHGGPGSCHYHLLTLADLAPLGYRVVLYDQLACGRSEGPKDFSELTFGNAIQEVEGFRRALRLGRIHLLGHSYGGALALAYALAYPEGLRSLIVSSGYPSMSILKEEGKKTKVRLPKWAETALSSVKRLSDLRKPEVQRAWDLFQSTFDFRGPVLPYELQRTKEEVRRAVNRRIGNGMHQDQWDIRSRLGEIRRPTLILTGEYDFIAPSIAKVLRRGIRGSKLHIFKGTGHKTNWERRSEYADVVQDFLSGVK